MEAISLTLTLHRVCEIVGCCGQKEQNKIVPMDDLARVASGGFLQLLTEDIHRRNHSTGRLMGFVAKTWLL